MPFENTQNVRIWLSGMLSDRIPAMPNHGAMRASNHE